MKAYQIIDKYSHQMSSTQLTLLVWLCNKYPNGILTKKISFPGVGDDHIRKSLNLFVKIGAVTWEHKQSYNSKIIPCL